MSPGRGAVGGQYSRRQFSVNRRAGGRASRRASEQAAGGRVEGWAGGRSAAARGRTLPVPGVARVPCAHRERRGRWASSSNRSGGRRQRRRSQCHLAAARLEVNTAGGNSATNQRESASGCAGERKSERAGGGWEGGRAGGRRERDRARAYAAGSGRRGWVRPSERAGPATSARGWFWAGGRASE